MKVTETNEPSIQAIKNSMKILLEIIKINKLYDKYLPNKAS